MRTQGITGRLTENKVQKRLRSVGIDAIRPKGPDKGIDFEIEGKVRIQVKGRGEKQTNNRYRWFQIRLTKKQRENASSVFEALQKKINLCDFFVLVSLKYDECWVFPSSVIMEIIQRNRIKHKNRKDNTSGAQAEMDLDIKYCGKSLTEIYQSFRENFDLIKDKLKDV